MDHIKKTHSSIVHEVENYRKSSESKEIKQKQPTVKEMMENTSLEVVSFRTRKFIFENDYYAFFYLNRSEIHA